MEHPSSPKDMESPSLEIAVPLELEKQLTAE